MLVGEMALEIRLLAKRGKGLRAIAREIGVSRNTVRRYLRDGDAERYRQRPRRSGKLAAFDDYIAKRLAEAAPDRLAGTVLLRELRERGYTGGYTILKDHLMLQRPLPVAAPVVRFETAPGEQMQVDWAVIRRGADRLSVGCPKFTGAIGSPASNLLQRYHQGTVLHDCGAMHTHQPGLLFHTEQAKAALSLGPGAQIRCGQGAAARADPHFGWRRRRGPIARGGQHKLAAGPQQ